MIQKQTISIEEIQSIALEILSVTEEILNRHGLKSYLAYGTALGAVRHNGFIPWDDDVDICMLRRDYNRAMEILKKELPDGYSLISPDTDDNYPYLFAKVKKDNTAFVHAGDAHLDINHGIYIDIFPFDDITEDEQEYKKLYHKAHRLNQINNLLTMSYRKGVSCRPCWQMLVIFLTRVFFNRKRIINKIHKIEQSYKDAKNESKYVAYYVSKTYGHSFFERRLLGNGKPFEFCGVKCFLPDCVEEYLTLMYGDYMQLPPKEKRVSHHDVIYMSKDHSYHPSMLKDLYKPQNN